MYKKICKYKKIIILCLVFTLSFNLISVKQEKEVQAVALVDDALLWMLGLLVLGTGVVAVSNTQVLDMGSNVFDLLKNDETELERTLKVVDGAYKFVKVTDKLKEIVDNVASTLTTEDKIEFTSEPSFTMDIPISSFPTISSKSVENLSDLGGFCIGQFLLKGNVKATYNGKVIWDEYYEESIVESFYAGYKYGNYGIGNLHFSEGKYLVNNFKHVTVLEDGVFKITSDELINSCLTIPYSDSRIKEGYNPTYTNENLKADTYIPIPAEVPTDTAISTDIPLDWEQAKAKGLVTDIPQDEVRQLTGDFTGDLTGEVTGSLDTGLDIAFPNIFEMLKELLIYLFYPTVAISDLFSIPAGSGFAGLVDLFNWDSLFNIEPKPYEFITDLNMNTLLEENEGSKTWHIELKLFDTQFMKNNIGIVRNVLSYSLLISVIYFVVYHFIPRRDMD